MALHQRVKIPIESLPMPGEERTGETFMWGGKSHDVIRRRLSWADRSRQVPLMRDGVPVSQKLKDGTERIVKTRRQIIAAELYADDMKAVPEDEFGIAITDGERPTVPNPKAYVEGIYIDEGVGMNRFLTTFREDPAVVERKRKEAERKAKWDKLLDSVDPDDLLASMTEPSAAKQQGSKRG